MEQVRQESPELIGAREFFRKFKTGKMRFRKLKQAWMKELRRNHPFTPDSKLIPQAKAKAEKALEAMEELVEEAG